MPNSKPAKKSAAGKKPKPAKAAAPKKAQSVKSPKSTAGKKAPPTKTGPAVPPALPERAAPPSTVPPLEKRDLSDPAVRAELKRRNLERFKDKTPGLFTVVTNHQPMSTLIVTDDGQPDVVFEGQHFYDQRHDDFVAEQLEAFWRIPQRLRMTPLQPTSFDETAGKFLHNTLQQGVEAGIEFSMGHSSDESYFLYIMGLGLGGHIFELVERTNCRALAIIDPNPEFLYHSMEVFDWCRLFDIIDEREGLISAFINTDPVVLSLHIREWLRTTNPCSVDGSTCFTHYNNPVFTAAMNRLIDDRDLILSGLGFFYDETLMLKNTHHNLYSGEERVYTRPTDQTLDAPVFVIGNGPSLDEDLDFIRENQDKAVIVSSGSALRPLVLGGILPDFQMETENIDVYPLIAQVAEDHDLSSIHLVTSSTVDTDVPPFFDTVLYYFRGSLSPYPIFCDTDIHCLMNPNPTVVNASLSFAQELGFRTYYLFGTDMGTTMGADKHHSKNAYQYTDGAILRPQTYDIPVAANFGGTCMTSDGMFWTRDAAEKAIREHARKRFYYNCSNGAKIEGTMPMPSKLVTLKDLPGGKQPVIDKIVECFPVYDRKTFDEHWNDDEMQKHFSAWLDRYIATAIEGADYDDLSYLTRLMGILRPAGGDNRADWGPALLYRGTCFQISMTFEYYLRRVPYADRSKFIEGARKEMMAAVDYMRETTVKEFATLSKDAAERLEKGSA